MAFVPLSGDEVFYAGGAEAFVEYFKGVISLADFQHRIVGFGWFMPGLSLALSPLYLVFHGPHLWEVRLYASVLTFLLWRWTIWEVRGAFGGTLSAALNIFPALASSWLLFTSTIWGDLVGGLVLTIVFARACRIAVRAAEDTPLPLREVFVLELTMALATYLRGSLLLPVLCVHIFLPAIWLISGHSAQFLPRLSKLAAGLLLFLALLTPWSFAASQVLGGWVLTTSTVPLSLGATFGDPNKLCFGPCTGANIWSSSVVFSRNYAKKFGLDELDVQRRMAAFALEGLSAHDYVKQVRQNLGSFVSEPASFSRRFVKQSQFGFTPTTSSIINRSIEVETVLFYLPFFLALVTANVGFFPRETKSQIEVLLLRLMTLCLFVQPFVHPSHSRYWVGFAPFMALSAGFLFRTWQGRFPAWAKEPRTDVGEQLPRQSIVGDRILLGLQVACAGCAVLILTLVYLL